MLAISRYFLYSSMIAFLSPLSIMFSEFTIDTRFPFMRSFATCEHSLPATWFVPSMIMFCELGFFSADLTCTCCLANYLHFISCCMYFYYFIKVHLFSSLL